MDNPKGFTEGLISKGEGNEQDREEQGWSEGSVGACRDYTGRRVCSGLIMSAGARSRDMQAFLKILVPCCRR